jgi:hypothetical protein
MNRDDVLRELELLPAWKLRVPVTSVLTQTAQAETMEATQITSLYGEESVMEKPVFEKSTSAAETQYEITMSEDKHWAFLCELDTTAGLMDIDSQGLLFKNILHALSIEKPSKMQLTSLADIQARIIVAMGESVAQALLNTQEPLENLRGKLHAIGSIQLVATCDLTHLLNNPLDKAKVWQDLCLARSYLQGLHVQD